MLFWIVLGIGLGLILGAVAAWAGALRLQDQEEPYGPARGEGLIFLAIGCLVFGLLPVGVVIAHSIGRVISQSNCEIRDERSVAEHEWVDYHFFKYSCELVTDDGRLTTDEVLPLELQGDRP